MSRGRCSRYDATVPKRTMQSLFCMPMFKHGNWLVSKMDTYLNNPKYMLHRYAPITQQDRKKTCSSTGSFEFFRQSFQYQRHKGSVHIFQFQNPNFSGCFWASFNVGLAGPCHRQLVLLRKLIHAQNGNDVLVDPPFWMTQKIDSSSGERKITMHNLQYGVRSFTIMNYLESSPIWCYRPHLGDK